MIVKLLIGQYSYLYHGEENIDELRKYINELTDMQYIIKWKDFQDDMIIIQKQIHLQICFQECKSKKKDTFKLYIIETFENQEKITASKVETSNVIQQNIMKQENQVQQQKVQEEKQEVYAQSTIIYNLEDKIQQQMDILKTQSPKKLIKIEPTIEEKQIFSKKCISLAFEEFFPGFNQYLEQNQNIKVQQ